MNKLKIGIVVAVIGVMVSSVVFAANLVSEVYFSNFKIKLNGAEYSPEMPVLNYLGRTYLALRELGTVTGNDIDFVNNEIIINNGEKETKQPKKVVNKEVIFNNQKHNLQIRYYYDDTVEPTTHIGEECYQAQVEVMFDNKCIIAYDYYMYNSEIETYIINDRIEDSQYLVLPICKDWIDMTIFYIIDNNGQIIGCVSDMSDDGATSINFKEEYRNEENSMRSKVTKYGIELCYPISQPGEEFYYAYKDVQVDWCKVIHTIEKGKILTNILKIYDGDMLESAGAV